MDHEEHPAKAEDEQSDHCGKSIEHEKPENDRV